MDNVKHGNQHVSRKRELMKMLYTAHTAINIGWKSLARDSLEKWRTAYALVPASTKRRWKCGR